MTRSICDGIHLLCVNTATEFGQKVAFLLIVSYSSGPGLLHCYLLLQCAFQNTEK